MSQWFRRFLAIGGGDERSLDFDADHTGVLARRLAADAIVLGMPRDSPRAAAIVKLARDHAEDLGLPPRMQGAGLAR